MKFEPVVGELRRGNIVAKGKPWHSMSIDEVFRALSTTAEGLSDVEAKSRLEKYGFNELVERARVSPIRLFIDQFKNFLVALLIVASIISAAIGEHVDSMAIMAIVILNAVLGFIQEYRAERALEALKKLAAPRARVRRGGREFTVLARELVPGDVIVLEPGDRVPADARLITCTDLKVDEAMLTGESVPVRKNAAIILPDDTPVADRKNMVFMGTLVSTGYGEAVVVSTGMNTEMGKIAAMVQEVEKEETPLMRKLNQFGKRIGALIIILCIVTFALGLFRRVDPILMFMTSVGLAVSAVPEGLPAVVTITLALGVKDMAKRNAIVRRLASVETLGCTTVICADKTGTMTKNEMTVRKIYVNGKLVEVTGAGYQVEGEFLVDGVNVNPLEDPHLELLLRIGLLCSHADLVKENGEWKVLGDPTEGALVVAAAKAGLWKHRLLKEYPKRHEIPFESSRKRMTTIHESRDGKLIAYVKGAPEVILERSKFIFENGSVRPITDADKERILRIFREMAEGALRVLAMAYRELPAQFEFIESDQVETELVFVGLAGMIDPPRDEVKDAIKQCRKAGIRVVMITGDHKLTAIAVAKEIGLVEGDNFKVLTGADLDKMSDEELTENVEKVPIFARVSPEHKVRIVRALKRRGHVVAMTGDGVNDAPALKLADIGVAMGIKGTDVAKEASDMILADDNFATIVRAVRDGRAIYDNIRKFVRFLLACNFDEIAVITTCILAGLPPALLPLQILWLNLVTDGGPAVALGVDPPDEDIMERPPRSPREGILSGMELFILVSALLQFVGTMAAYLLGMYLLKDSVVEARTLAFVQAVLFELFVVFNCRSEKHSVYRIGFLTNKALVIADVVGILLTIMLVYAPPMQLIFDTVPLTLYDWALCILLASGAWFVLPEIFMRPLPFTRKQRR
ncbi:MAG: calcium-translocating P-type ATPase, SERCA-type [archaeon GB-1867-005]|nr:calcium-translocating P-type ATPase, SERCA-type [Candidatus Culexmicrobium cathedralense]